MQFPGVLTTVLLKRDLPDFQTKHPDFYFKAIREIGSGTDDITYEARLEYKGDYSLTKLLQFQFRPEDQNKLWIGDKLAIKKFHDPKSISFKNEARILKYLKRLYMASIDEGWIAQELIPGVTLAHRMKLSDQAEIDGLKEIYMEKARLSFTELGRSEKIFFHGDIRPQNIMVPEEGQLTVGDLIFVDFGASGVLPKTDARVETYKLRNLDYASREFEITRFILNTNYLVHPYSQEGIDEYEKKWKELKDDPGKQAKLEKNYRLARDAVALVENPFRKSSKKMLTDYLESLNHPSALTFLNDVHIAIRSYQLLLTPNKIQSWDLAIHDHLDILRKYSFVEKAQDILESEKLANDVALTLSDQRPNSKEILKAYKQKMKIINPLATYNRFKAFTWMRSLKIAF